MAVDDQYSGLIPKTEAQGQYRPGEKVSCRVTNVREDGKLNLSPRKKHTSRWMKIPNWC